MTLQKGTTMYDPIRFIKDLIDLIRDPAGEAVAAVEISDKNRDIFLEFLAPEHKKYVKNGDFALSFENSSTIVPAKEFHKHYAFDAPTDPEGLHMTPVRTIKPL